MNEASDLEGKQPADNLPKLIGHSIGKYKVVRVLGQGGMGTVYEAVHEDILQSAAVKVLRPALSQEPKFAQRFFDEAKAVSRVQHPGLIKIFDFNRLPDGTLYLMMEFLRGELLWDRILRFRQRPEGGAFAYKDAVRITRQLASALAAVHKAGIIHRDLKHENVFLVPDPDTPSGERAKILDFGIAKQADVEVGRTTGGLSIGTPGYMSPEQCDGSIKITERSDVYSLGVTAPCPAA
jgi:serine/threonine-protein kinase